MTETRTRSVRRLVPGLLLVAALGMSRAADDPKPPWQRLLRGEDAQRAQALRQQSDDCVSRERWPDAVAAARELLALREKLQGTDHWETRGPRLRLATLEQMAAKPAEQQQEFVRLRKLEREAEGL